MNRSTETPREPALAQPTGTPQLPSDDFLKEVRAARQVWLDENDPKDGSDCVIPFDRFLYNVRPTAFLESVAAEAERRYPADQTVDDPCGQTGQARTDEYGYQECARRAFLAGVVWSSAVRFGSSS